MDLTCDDAQRNTSISEYSLACEVGRKTCDSLKQELHHLQLKLKEAQVDLRACYAVLPNPLVYCCVVSRLRGALPRSQQG